MFRIRTLLGLMVLTALLCCNVQNVTLENKQSLHSQYRWVEIHTRYGWPVTHLEVGHHNFAYQDDQQQHRWFINLLNKKETQYNQECSGSSTTWVWGAEWGWKHLYIQ